LLLDEKISMIASPFATEVMGATGFLGDFIRCRSGGKSSNSDGVRVCHGVITASQHIQI
jgi:hypothetical protein